MSDRLDQAKLMALEGEQTCECCGVTPLRPEDCDVVDGEVTCMDCVHTYYPAVYARRTGEAHE